MSWWAWLIVALVSAFAYFTLAVGIGRLLRDQKANKDELVQRLEATRDEIRAVDQAVAVLTDDLGGVAVQIEGLNPDIASIMANMSESEQRALADQVFEIKQRRNAT